MQESPIQIEKMRRARREGTRMKAVRRTDHHLATARHRRHRSPESRARTTGRTRNSPLQDTLRIEEPGRARVVVVRLPNKYQSGAHASKAGCEEIVRLRTRIGNRHQARRLPPFRSLRDVTRENGSVADLNAPDRPIGDLHSSHRARSDLSLAHGCPDSIPEVLHCRAGALSAGGDGDKGTARSVDPPTQVHRDQLAAIGRGRDRKPRANGLLRSPRHAGVGRRVNLTAKLDCRQLSSVGGRSDPLPDAIRLPRGPSHA